MRQGPAAVKQMELPAGSVIPPPRNRFWATASGVDPARLFDGRRILVVAHRSRRRARLVQALTERNAWVCEVEPGGVGLLEARLLDPSILLMDPMDMGSHRAQVMRILHADTRLRWTSIVHVGWDRLWALGEQNPDLLYLTDLVGPVLEPELLLGSRCLEDEEVDVGIAYLGPNRVLRAFKESGKRFDLVAHTRGGVARIRLEGETVLRAHWVDSRQAGGTALELHGSAALTAFLGLQDGHVRGTRVTGDDRASPAVETRQTARTLQGFVDPHGDTPVSGLVRKPEASAGVDRAGAPATEAPQRPKMRSRVLQSPLRRRNRVEVLSALDTSSGAVRAGEGLGERRVSVPDLPTWIRLEHLRYPVALAVLVMLAAATFGIWRTIAPPSMPRGLGASETTPAAPTEVPARDRVLFLPAVDVTPVTSGEVQRAVSRRVLRRWVRQGRSSLDRGNLDVAQGHFERVLSQEKDNSRALAGLAKVMLARRESSRALDLSVRVVRLKPRRASYHVIHGDALLLAGRRDEAKRSWETALRLAPRATYVKRRLAEL